MIRKASRSFLKLEEGIQTKQARLDSITQNVGQSEITEAMLIQAKKVQVFSNYRAEEFGELEMKEGEIIAVIEEHPSGISCFLKEVVD